MSGLNLFTIALIRKTFKQRFLFAKFSKLPLLGRFIDHLFFEGDDIIYLPKEDVARTIQVNKSIERHGNMVLPSQVVKYFINQANYHWIMNFCICRTSNQCKDYPISLGCLFLGEASINIDPRLGRRVTKEEALEHLKRCQEAGLVNLVGRNKIDTVWLNIGPKEKLLTICNCCPCCCLWRMLPELPNKIASKITRMPGINVKVDPSKCIGCKKCTRGVCFVDAISMSEEKAVIGENCRACGRCVEVCPKNAIELSINDPEFIQKSISRIQPLVDLK